MNDQTIPYRRLYNQHISGGRLETPEQVIKQLGCMQAQDYHQAVWAVGLRTLAGTLADVEQSIEHGKLILTWPIRGTIHFVSPEDVRWMLKLSVSRTQTQDKRRMEQLELNQEIIERCKQIFYSALHGHKRKSRDVLMQLLKEAAISTNSQRGYFILWYLARTGFICMGPREGKQQTFVLLDEWVAQTKEFSLTESHIMLAQRYFTSHGPATVQDFSWWGGITLSDARKGMEGIESQLLSEKKGNEVYWEIERAKRGKSDDESTVYLLPGFDEHMLGYKDRSSVLRAEYAASVVPGNNGVFMPTIIINGQIVGIWKRTIKSKGIHIEFKLFEPKNDKKECILTAAESYCRFIGLPLASTTFQIME